MSRGVPGAGGKWIRSCGILTAALAAACAASPLPVQPQGESSRAQRTRTLKAEPGQSRGTSWGRRTFLYPVRWGRAEDLVKTLEPILERLYGPGARVVAQRESNSLLIVLPERDDAPR